ncbi:MAG: NAD-dependent epimerase/dehydratase family protein [Xanthomonadales bacterium]|nr:NAD-dependent epimerase/dehydratase family protein [Xanthomonadales bacterium]
MLVLGGTNFVGPAIVDAALSRGHRVTLFNRGITRPELFPNAEKLRGLRGTKREDLSALSGTRHWDAVVDVWPEQSALVESTAKLLVDRVSFYYFISSIAVYRDYSRPGVKETAEVRRNDPGYGGEKSRAESIIGKLYADRYGVARCHSIFGPRDPGSTLHYWLRRFAAHNQVAAPGDGGDPIQFVDVRDVALWVVQSIERKLAGIYNMASAPMPFREFLAACKSAVDSSAALTWIEKDFIYQQGIRAFNELPLWIPKEEDPGFFGISSEKAQQAGMRFRPHQETVAAAWNWYRSAFFKDTQFPHNGWGISRQREERLLHAWQDQVLK